MLTRLAACFVSLGLLGGVAPAHTFARPPIDTEEVAVAMPMRVSPDREEVRKALAKRRAKNLKAFRVYRNAGVYPHNWVRSGPLNVWMDPDGHLCAAASMISQDGKHKLVLEIGATDNNIRLLNVTDGALLDWMLTSGFTIEEIDAIQVPGFGMEDWQRQRRREFDWTAEDARLRKAYAKTDAQLVKNQKSSLDLAVNRLLQNPDLAWKLVEGNV